MAPSGEWLRRFVPSAGVSHLVGNLVHICYRILKIGLHLIKLQVAHSVGTKCWIIIYSFICQSFVQVLCNCLLMLTVNMAGMFTHYPTEMAQRRAFLETRRCIQARLVTQRENQQQV